MRKLKTALVSSIVLSPLATFATGSAPLDLSSTGDTVAGYIATAAGAGVAILAAMYGIRVIVRAFKAVK